MTEKCPKLQFKTKTTIPVFGSSTIFTKCLFSNLVGKIYIAIELHTGVFDDISRWLHLGDPPGLLQFFISNGWPIQDLFLIYHYSAGPFIRNPENKNRVHQTIFFICNRKHLGIVSFLSDGATNKSRFLPSHPLWRHCIKS